MTTKEELLEKITCDPLDSKAYLDLAKLLEKDESIKLYDDTKMSGCDLCVKCIELAPTCADAYDCLGGNLTRDQGLGNKTVVVNKRLMVKQDCHKKAVELEPTRAAFLRNLALALADNERVTIPNATPLNRRGLLLKAIELDPRFCLAYVDLANGMNERETVTLHNKDEMTRYELFLKAIKVDPTGDKGQAYKDFARSIDFTILHGGEVLAKSALLDLGKYYAGELDPGFFASATEFFPAIGELERETFSLMYIKTNSFEFAGMAFGPSSTKKEVRHTICLADGPAVKQLRDCTGDCRSASFQVVDLMRSSRECVPDIVALFTDETTAFNHDRLCCLRIRVKDNAEAQAAAEVVRLCPKYLHAIELFPSNSKHDSTMQTSAFDIAMSVAANNKLSVKHFIVNSPVPPNANTNNAMRAAQNNPNIKFAFGKQTTPLNQIATERFADSCDVELPPVIPFRDVKWDEMFGFATSQGLVRCDFKDLHKHSVTLQNMYDPENDDGKEPCEPLEKYTGSNVGVRTVAVQLVVMYVSAKDKDGKQFFASEEATNDAKLKPTVWRMSLTDEVFVKHIAANSNDAKDEVSLCAEMLGIATFLHIPALQRLIFSHLVRMWKEEKVKPVITEYERKKRERA